MDKGMKVRAVLRLLALAAAILAAWGIIPDDVAPAIEQRIDELVVAVLALSEGYFWTKGKKQ